MFNFIYEVLSFNISISILSIYFVVRRYGIGTGLIFIVGKNKYFFTTKKIKKEKTEKNRCLFKFDISLSFYPHPAVSDGGTGLLFHILDAELGTGFSLFYGKYCIEYNIKKGFDFCNHFADGVGG